jgi:hypothetical protein
VTMPDRPDILNRHQAWFDGQLDLELERLVFVEETWASTKMARSHGRCPRGERLRMSVPHGHVWTSGNRGCGWMADNAVIRALRPGGFDHRRRIDDPLCWLGRVAEIDGDLCR